MLKTINLIVYSSNAPFEFTILTCNNNFIAKNTVNSSPTQLCLITNSCCLKFIAKYQNQTIVKSYIPSNCRCQNLTVGFSFSALETQPIQKFTLTDTTYGIPVTNAILNFNK